jgi:hypothetical protein
MEADLGRRLSGEDLQDKAKMRDLEPQLLNRITLDIFDGAATKAPQTKGGRSGTGEARGGGEGAAKEEVTTKRTDAERGGGGVTFTDFRLLYADGNDKYGSAQRGDNFYIFNFGTS